MQDFERILRDAVNRNKIAMFQGWAEGMPLSQFLRELEAGPRSLAIGWIVSALIKPGGEGERQAHIAKINNLDKTGWDLDPGISPGYDSEFLRRPEWPAVQEAAQAVREWMARMGPGLLTLAGHTGIGKTHLAVAAARGLLERGFSVAYREEAALVASLQQQMKGGDPEELLQEYLTVPWLILDEFGGGALGDWGKSVTDRIINARWQASDALRTLICTNLVGIELPQRIASRLSDVRKARTVVIKASDYRKEEN
jgi:hypothetical protein